MNIFGKPKATSFEVSMPDKWQCDLCDYYLVGTLGDNFVDICYRHLHEHKVTSESKLVLKYGYLNQEKSK